MPKGKAPKTRNKTVKTYVPKNAPNTLIDLSTPVYFQMPTYVQAACNTFERETERNPHNKPTLSGLADILGFKNVKKMEAFLEEHKDSELEHMQQVVYLIEKAKLRVVKYYEQHLTGNSNPSGAKFALETFGGWKVDPETPEQSFEKMKRQFVDQLKRYQEICKKNGWQTDPAQASIDLQYILFGMREDKEKAPK
jgi:hypothetical protein